MANLEQLVVSLVAETQGLKAELGKATKVTQDASTKMDKSIKEFTENSTKQMGFWQSSMSTAVGFLGSQAILGAVSAFKDAALGLFNTLVTDGVAAAQVQEDAINRLNTALAVSGQYSREASQDIQAYASSLQQATKYGDEAILETSALIQSLGGLEKEGLKRATGATLDMAAALGIDLKAAATLVGKAAVGEISSFTRYGVVIKSGANAAETFENALTALSSKFGGTAAQQVKTFSGSLQQTKNTFGDLTETIGFTITQNQAVIAVIGEMNKIFGDTNGALGEQSQAYKELVANGVIVFAEALASTIAVFDAVGRVGGLFSDTIEGVFANLGAVVTGVLKVFSSDYEEAFNAFTMQATEAAKSAEERFTGDSFLGDVSVKLYEIRDAAAVGLGEIKKGAEAAIEPTNSVKEAVVELTAEEQKRLDNLKSFATALADQGAAAETEYSYQLDLLKMNLGDKLIAEEEYFISRQEMLDEQQAAELEKLNMAYNNKLISDAEYNDAKKALEMKQHLESIKLGQERAKVDEALNKKRSEDMKSTLGTISSLQQSNNKGLAAAGKAAAITQATIDGYAAVQKALASAPPPFNFVLAGLVGAATAQNISKIKSVGLNQGGTLMGGGANRDTVPATLTKGETVITRDTTDRLSKFLERSEGGGSEVPTARVELSFRGEEFVEFLETKILERRRLGIALI